jgi:hypothetical protein
MLRATLVILAEPGRDSTCEVRTFTIANSAATKNPFSNTKKMVINISSAIQLIFRLYKCENFEMISQKLQQLCVNQVKYLICNKCGMFIYAYLSRNY